jgi:hypothetical protein
MTWPNSRDQLSEAERNLLATLSQLPRLHPIVSMFAFGPSPYRADGHAPWGELAALARPAVTAT